MTRTLAGFFLPRLMALGLVAFLAACASQPAPSGKTGAGAYKVGEPYQINGTWYYPREDYSYDETGIASWYGTGFHGQATANGEIFNKNELTAAHKTLPLPTLARITNLDNGRSIVVRINDRGPFSGARIIDVSQRTAQLLGFEQQGTAKVRVQVLADESKAIADAMRHYGSATPSAMASAEGAPSPGEPLPLVQSAALEPVEVKQIAAIETTPEVHKQLLATKPVAQVVQVPVTGQHQIYVQAGAFTVLENATKLQQHLSPYGTVSLSNALVNGQKFYRVRLGPLASVNEADAMLSKVKNAGVAGARTVVD
jgi:rare lipoprotein A